MRFRVIVVLVCLAVAGHGAFGAGQTTASTQLVYATAVNAGKAAIVDLDPADFVVKEDGKECPVIAVERANSTMQVAILVDDNGTGIFRFGLNGLGELLQGRAEIALSVVTNQVQKLFDYTPNAKDWFAGFSRTGVRPATPEGGQLLEGVFATARELKSREAKRPIILALTVGGEEQSPLAASQVLDALHRSRASLHVLYVDIPAVRPTKPAGRPSDLLEGNFNLSRVLGDGPKESGGRRREVLAMKALTSEVQLIARDLLNHTRLPMRAPLRKTHPRSCRCRCAGPA